MEHLLEYFGVLTGLAYLILEIMQHRAMWIVGFITSLTYIFVFFFAKFYADMSLNIYYVCMSIYGFWQWTKRPALPTKTKMQIVYRHVSRKWWVGFFSVTVLLYGIIYWLLSCYTDSPLPMGDAFTTALSITATYMLAKRFLEHWWVWVIVNFVSVSLYYQRGLYPTCLLFICCGILAIIGWFNWRKKGVLYGEKL